MAPSTLDAADAQQRQFEQLAAAAQDPEQPVRERARKEIQRLLSHQDADLRAQAYLLYGQRFAAQDQADAALAFWTGGREHLPAGSVAHQYCTLGLAYSMITLKRIDEAKALAKEVHAVAAEASPRGIEAVVMLGLAAAVNQNYELARADLTRAEWLINQGPDYAVAGYEGAWLTALRVAAYPFDPNDEEGVWSAAEWARDDGRWPAALQNYQAYLERWPTGTRCAAAEWAVGLCLARTGNAAAGAAHWQAFIARGGKGSYRGLAWLGLADIALIDDADPDEAGKLIAQGIAWCGDFPAATAPADVYSAWNQLHVRAAILAYVRQDRPLVDRCLAEAAAVSDPLPNLMQKGTLSQPPDVSSVVSFLKGGGKLVPQNVLDSEYPKASLLLNVAAFHDQIDQETVAILVYQRILKEGLSANPHQRLYALQGLAAMCREDGDADGAVAAHARILEEFPTATVVPRTMYRMAMVMYAGQLKRDPARKVLDEILRRFPDDEVAPEARFYRMQTCIWGQRWREAAADLAALEQRYPHHQYREVIDVALRPRILAGLDQLAKQP